MMLDVVGSRSFVAALQPLEPRHQVIVDILISRPRVPVPIKELVEALYGTRLDGGPERPANIVGKSVFDLRRRGFNIITIGWRGYAFVPRSTNGDCGGVESRHADDGRSPGLRSGRGVEKTLGAESIAHTRVRGEANLLRT